MKQVELDLTDPDLLESALNQYLSFGVCPASHLPPPAPLEEVEIHVELPKNQVAVWSGRCIRTMGPGSFLVELAPPPNLAWLGSLLVPDDFPEEKTPVEVSEEFGPEDFPEESQEGDQEPSPFAPQSGEMDVQDALKSMDAELEGEALAESAGPLRGLPAGITGIESEFSDLYKRIGELAIHEKRQLARQGGKTARQLLVKDPNKTLHMFVMMNPKITLEEVEEYSKLPGLSAEAIRHMVKNRTWMSAKSVLFNLVRNPATPTDIAVALVPKLGSSEWRAITNSANIRSAIAAAARKLLFK